MSSHFDFMMNAESDLVDSEVGSLRNQISELQRKLDRSAATIMKLRGSVDQITDGGVRKRFEDIFGAIQDWVGEIELDLMRHSRDFRQDFEDVLHREEREELLYELGLRAQDEDENGRLVWNINSRDYLDMRWLGSLSTCVNVILCRFIWHRLRHYIFYSVYPVGLNKETERGLDYIFSAMRENDHGDTTTGSSVTFSIS